MNWLQLFVCLGFSLVRSFALGHLPPDNVLEGQGNQRLTSLCQCQGQEILSVKIQRKLGMQQLWGYKNCLELGS